MADDQKPVLTQGTTALPSTPIPQPQESDGSWLQRHIIEIVIGIIVAIAGFLSVRAINQIDGRLDNMDKDGKSLNAAFVDFKSNTQKKEDDLTKAIRIASENFDKKTKNTIRTIIGMNKQQSSLESSLSAAQTEVREAKNELKALQSQVQKAAPMAEVEGVKREVETIRTHLDDLSSQASALNADSRSSEKDRILIEARRRLNQLDEQYLYAKAHSETLIKIPPISSLLGATARIVPRQEEYQLSRVIRVDIQKGTLILSGKLKKQTTKNDLKSLMESIPGVSTVDDGKVKVEGS